MIGMTRQQKRLLEFLKSHVRDRGSPPTFDEMKDALGLKSKSGIHRILTALEERGYIQRLPNRARAINIVDQELADSIMFLPANHRQFLIWYASKHNTTPRALIANCVREWAIRNAA